MGNRKNVQWSWHVGILKTYVLSNVRIPGRDSNNMSPYHKPHPCATSTQFSISEVMSSQLFFPPGEKKKKKNRCKCSHLYNHIVVFIYMEMIDPMWPLPCLVHGKYFPSWSASSKDISAFLFKAQGVSHPPTMNSCRAMSTDTCITFTFHSYADSPWIFLKWVRWHAFGSI